MSGKIKKIVSLFMCVVLICGLASTNLEMLYKVFAGTKGETIAQYALSQVGTKERSAGSDDIIYNDWFYGRRVSNAYSAQYAWCQVFVAYCANQCGIGTDIIPKTASCRNAVSWFQQRGLYQTRSSGYQPKVGDIVFFRTDSTNIANHVGIVYAVDNNNVYYVDGNNTGTTPHGVAKSVKARTNNTILGYGTPSYGNNTCNCSESYAGNYIVNTSSLPLNIRSSHSTSSAVIGSIPKGSKVYVSKADGTWAHVTYGNISGYCSMQYLKKETIDRNIKVQCWFSNTGMGDEISNCKTGEKIYFCYKIYDDATGKLWNELEDCNYQVKEIVYNPDGSVHGSFTYENSDNNWIAFTPDVEGEYKGRIELTGDRTGSVEFSINAKMITIRLHGWFSDSKMGDEIETVNVGESLFLCYELFDVETGKPWNEIENVDYHVKAYICDPSGKDVGCRMFDNVDSDWCHVKPSDTGTYTGRVEITGARSGDIEIEITVNQNYAITYDVNGGNFSAPEKQIKKNDTNIVIEDYAGQYYDSIMLYGNGGVFGNDETSHMCTLVRPFLNWNTKSDGTGLVVNAGSIYGKNEDLALYAQYKALGQISIIPVFEREGYKLINWNTKADGSGISYEITDSIPIGTSLYAQWEYEMKPTEKPLVTPKPAVSETPVTSIPQESETPSTSQPQESGTPVIIKPIASDLPSVLPEKGMLGDVDLDKDVDLVDAQIVLKIALGIVERADSLNIDIDDNLIINLKDAQIILKAALGICLLQ